MLSSKKLFEMRVSSHPSCHSKSQRDWPCYGGHERKSAKIAGASIWQKNGLRVFRLPHGRRLSIAPGLLAPFGLLAYRAYSGGRPCVEEMCMKLLHSADWQAPALVMRSTTGAGLGASGRCSRLIETTQCESGAAVFAGLMELRCSAPRKRFIQQTAMADISCAVKPPEPDLGFAAQPAGGSLLADVFGRQAESVRGSESEPRSWGTVSTPYPANSGCISLIFWWKHGLCTNDPPASSAGLRRVAGKLLGTKCLKYHHKSSAACGSYASCGFSRLITASPP